MIKSANLSVLLLIFFVLGIATMGCAQGSYGQLNPANKAKPSNYKECVAAGYPALRSYPGKCIADGQTFVDDSVTAPALGQPQFKKPRPEAICVDMCGDGDCQEIVCQGSGCPCSENQESCSADCDR